MKNNYPIEMKINIWDFIDIDKLNEYADKFCGEILSDIEYFAESINENGDLVLSICPEESEVKQ